MYETCPETSHVASEGFGSRLKGDARQRIAAARPRNFPRVEGLPEGREN